MAFSNSLAERIRHLLARRRGVTEKKMFGGICFLLHGNLLVGVWKESMIARIGKDAYESALQKDHVAEFDITERTMKGWVMIDSDGVDSEADLTTWVDLALAFVRTLPAK